MGDAMRELTKIMKVRSEPPETTPRLSDIIQKEKAGQTVSEYLFTTALRGHAKLVFDASSTAKARAFGFRRNMALARPISWERWLIYWCGGT